MPDVKVVIKGAQTELLDEDDIRARKPQCLVAMLVVSTAWGAMLPFLIRYAALKEVTGLVVSVVTIVLMVAWCRYDSHERDFEIKRPLLWLIILVFFIGIPAYLLASRGIRGIVSIAFALGFAIVCLLAGWLAIHTTLAFL